MTENIDWDDPEALAREIKAQSYRMPDPRPKPVREMTDAEMADAEDVAEKIKARNEVWG